MLIVALINVPDEGESRHGIPVDTALDVLAESVLARVQDEAGYLDTGFPITPGEVTVHALHDADPDLGQHTLAAFLDGHAAATARGHGPL